MQSDFTVENHGTIFLLRPNTQAAKDWIENNVSDECQWFGTALAVEHGYIFDIIDGIQSDGLTVEGR